MNPLLTLRLLLIAFVFAGPRELFVSNAEA
jgi:hypothetical protein